MDASVQGDPIEIAFNPHYLLDGLGALEAPVARLSFVNAAKPAVLTGATERGGDAVPGYRYLLMPVRLAG
jgi:DNA polymerase III subunit beta